MKKKSGRIVRLSEGAYERVLREQVRLILRLRRPVSMATALDSLLRLKVTK